MKLYLTLIVLAAAITAGAVYLAFVLLAALAGYREMLP